MALCAWYSRPATLSVTSLKRSLSNRFPRSSDSLHSGTLNWTMLLWPEMFTLSATTLTSQNIVSLSSGSRPFASSSRKSRRMNFLKPQSLPCTNRYALQAKERKRTRLANCLIVTERIKTDYNKGKGARAKHALISKCIRNALWSRHQRDCTRYVWTLANQSLPLYQNRHTFIKLFWTNYLIFTYFWGAQKCDRTAEFWWLPQRQQLHNWN